MNLLTEIRSLFRPALTAMVPEPALVPEFLAAIKPTANPEHGDYQANCAMALGKVLGQKPPQVAQQLVAALPANDRLEKPTIAGPGFINLRFKTEFLAQALRQIATDPKLGVAPVAAAKTYVIDYSSPNVAKPLHVGHLRSTIIGDAITRILRFLGHKVITDNHLGDWGTQFGILLYGYKNFRNDAAFAADPVRELLRLYVHVRHLAHLAEDDDDDAATDNPVMAACREETAKLHAGDPENVALWKLFMPACMEMLRPIYERLGILPFDYQHGESFYHPMLPAVVEELLAKKIAFESHGAIVIPNAKGIIPQTPEEQKKEDPPAIIRKRDGAFTYMTSDLATIKYRAEQFQPHAILYVVGAPQALHFKTLFAQARRWGYTAIDFQHIQFGSMLGPDRKMFATRKGGTVELMELLDDAAALSLQKYEAGVAERRAHGHKVYEATAAEKQMIAEVVGVGAVKYADLSQNRTTDYVFDLDKMTATVGNTAAYMQYAYARCCGIFREGQVDPARFRHQPPDVIFSHPAERALALQLLRFPEAVENAAAEYYPHLMTAYLWELAKSYSVFFENCPVLKAETPQLRDSRLLLVDLVARTIRQSLELLGIGVMERM
ncbi:MAG: arginine--tRNA ligase [Gemmataceae bacterium]|nr:arginine--tRNA ligase [Gemmata sp.]MDW8199098.1 arginine--tRNA ligase [Gemmataceae bacterium]